MKTTCLRQGQVEIGIIIFEGWEFSALGASIVGRHITGYTGPARTKLLSYLGLAT
jgi:hypothetical protein